MYNLFGKKYVLSISTTDKEGLSLQLNATLANEQKHPVLFSIPKQII